MNYFTQKPKLTCGTRNSCALLKEYFDPRVDQSLYGKEQLRDDTKPLCLRRKQVMQFGMT